MQFKVWEEARNDHRFAIYDDNGELLCDGEKFPTGTDAWYVVGLIKNEYPGDWRDISAPHREVTSE